jgi:hypothetical protein
MGSFREKVGGMQQAGGKAWEEFKSGMDAAMDDLREAYNKALYRFK